MKLFNSFTTSQSRILLFSHGAGQLITPHVVRQNSWYAFKRTTYTSDEHIDTAVIQVNEAT